MSKTIIINLLDDITIKSISNTYRKLIIEFKEFDEILIDCSGVNQCDISAIQLLVSARKSAIAKRLDVRLSGVTGALNAALVRAGISPAQLPDSILINGA